MERDSEPREPKREESRVRIATRTGWAELSRSSSSHDAAAERAHSRLEDGQPLERVTFRATDEQLVALQSLVDDDVYHSRSEALRAGVRRLLERHDLSEIDRNDE